MATLAFTDQFPIPTKARFRDRVAPGLAVAIGAWLRRTGIGFFTLLMFGSPATTMGADISSHDRGVLIRGTIQKGDYAKIAQFIKQPSNYAKFTQGIFLDSTGGDLPETIRISHLMDKSSSATFVGTGARCHRACFVLWMSGVTRHLSRDATLGVGRLALDASEEVEPSRYLNVARRVDNYLAVLGTPQIILAMLSAGPPSGLYVMTQRWLVEQELLTVVSYRSSFLELAQTRCGVEPYAAILKDPVSAEDDYQDWILRFKKWNACLDTLRADRRRTDAAIIAALIDD